MPVLSQLLDHPNMNSRLDPQQSVYRTQTIEKIVSDLLTALDSRDNSVLSLLDLSAIFDTISHCILFSRLQSSYGIFGTALSLFRSYLSDRSETVSANGLYSTST